MDYYDEISEGYNELHEEEQLKKINIIKRYLKVNKADKLLDVGCGTGISTKPWNCQRYGIDPSEKLLEKARLEKCKEKIEYKLAPAERIPYPNDFFHVVISITAIQNFQDIEKGLKEIKRVGKNRFVLSFLKKSPKKDFIIDLIKKYFKIKKVIEEDKDLVYFCCALLNSPRLAK